MPKIIFIVLLMLALTLKISVHPKYVAKSDISYILAKKNIGRSKPYSNILTKIKNYTIKAIYKTKLLTYVNDINNLNLGNGKNEFYLIAMPLSEKFNPFVGTFCHGNIQYSDKASLPIFIYDILLNTHIEVPWNFVIEKVDIKMGPIYQKMNMPEVNKFCEYENVNALDRVFINVLDFKAKKNFIFLPTWVMKSLQLKCFDVVRLKFVKLDTASSVVLQPHHKKFFNLSEPKVIEQRGKESSSAEQWAIKILEEKLRYYSCITKNSTIRIRHNNVDYHFDVVRIDSEKKKNVEVASIQDTDVIFDFVKEKYHN
ncbi:ubiquitin fusion degradation protein 1, putative [Plasmodium ovale]|uniref:Ubiquitin fusion degradation protein 1, putative n=1 Tax=Plasmodium ovale TaxID=36330 RepID=A0A1D3U7S0_PLAOA|nr:ubiquitin fusion degradation protein 1, putative [Plasmodium ovale]